MGTPRLGIFWMIGEENVSFTVRLCRAEHAGQIRELSPPQRVDVVPDR